MRRAVGRHIRHIAEVEYGRPSLDRGLRYHGTSLKKALRYALIALDSTMRSNASVGPPIDLAIYAQHDRSLRHRRFEENDPDLLEVRRIWDQTLGTAVADLPLPHPE